MTHILTVTDDLTVTLECTAEAGAECRPLTLLGAPTACRWSFLSAGELRDAVLDALDRRPGWQPGQYELRSAYREGDGFLNVHLGSLLVGAA